MSQLLEAAEHLWNAVDALAAGLLELATAATNGLRGTIAHCLGLRPLTITEVCRIAEAKQKMVPLVAPPSNQQAEEALAAHTGRLKSWLSDMVEEHDECCDCRTNPDISTCTELAMWEEVLEMEKAYSPRPGSLKPERLQGSERIYFEKWCQHVERYDPGEYLLGGRPATRAEMVAMTQLVQWLGTNCGRAFLLDCEQASRESDAFSRLLRDPVDIRKWTGTQAQEGLLALVTEHLSPKHIYAVSRIESLLKGAFHNWERFKSEERES